MRLATTARATQPARILLMDDEEIVREVASFMLMHIGCEVDVAQDGAEAVAIYTEAIGEQRPYDAVIADLNVASGMGGDEAAHRLREIDPAANVILATGDNIDADDIECEESGFCAAVGKPFTLGDLSATLRQIGLSVAG